MTRSGGLAAVMLVVGTSSLAHADGAADEWKGLIGTWTVESATLNGADSKELFKTLTLTMEQGKYKVDFGGMVDAGTVKLDLDKKPKQMTIVGTEGTNQGRTHYAIYELDKVTLKICYALDGGPAPKGFESKADSMTLLVTYKRDTK